MKDSIIGITQDLLKIFGVNLPASLVGAYTDYHKRKAAMLQEVILSEIRQGDFSRMDDDDKISIALKLHHSALEGVAKKKFAPIMSSN